MQRFVIFLLFALVPILAQAQMYKWVDENGHTQYSDRPPPPGIKADQVSNTRTPAPAPAAGASAPAKSNAARELDFRKRQLAADEKAKADEKKQQQDAIKKQNCETAQSRLRTLQDGGRIIKPSTTGEREYMSSEEIDAEKVTAQQRADEACK